MVRPSRWTVAGALTLNALHGIAITFQTLVPKYLIDGVLLPTNLNPSSRWHRLAWLVAAYLLASVVARMIVWHIGFRLFTGVREKVILALRARLFRQVNSLCLRFRAGNPSGELYSYLFGAPLQQVQAYFQQFTFGAPGAVFVLISTVVWVGSWDPLLTGVLLASVLGSVVLMRYARRRVHGLTLSYQQTESDVGGYTADLLRGGRDLKLYAMEDRAADDFERRAAEVGRRAYDRDVRGHYEWMKNETVGYVAFAALCAAAAWRYLYDQSHKPPDARLTVGEIQAYLTAFASLQNAVTTLFNLAAAKGAAQAGADRLSAVLRTGSTTPDPADTEARSAPGPGAIEFSDVTFGYTADQPILRNLSLTIPYGQRVALVGPSGSGKSTLTQLLLRLYDPDEGSITIAGTELRHVRGADLRRRFGVVPQDPFVFRATLRDNLRVARPDADDRQIENACRRANAWGFITNLPEGLDTRVNEAGSSLSGGQRQRLAIGRALLAEPDFFVFDEATSALDTVSEKAVQQAVDAAAAGRTAIVVAHRLSTVRDCDRVLVMADGRIAQDGTYEDLAARPGLFRDLIRGQAMAA